MGKVYLAFLGTNDYLPCTYFKDDKQLESVRFVQEATLHFFCRDWTHGDRVLIFTTPDAFRKNWQDNGHKDSKTGNVLERKGLKRCLVDMQLAVPFINITIPEGQSEREIWEIFRVVFDQLKEGDEVVFDITHAFRSIPMLAIVVLNYAKIIKEVTLRGIYYGAFEVLGSIQEARKIPLKERRVPVLDLTAFDVLLDWSFAIDSFLAAGNAVRVCSLADSAIRPLLKETQGQDKQAAIIRNVTKELGTLSKTLATCRGPKIGGVVNSLKKAVGKTDYIHLLPPFQPLFDRIKTQMSAFAGNAIADGIEAANWCLQHNLIQQGYTILQETLLTHFVIERGGDPEAKKDREIASQAATIYLRNLPESRWEPPAKTHRATTQGFLEFYEARNKWPKIFNKLSAYRNDLNHAGYRKNAARADSFKKALSELLDETGKYLGLE